MPARSAHPVTRPPLRRPQTRRWNTTPRRTAVRRESAAADLRDQHDLAVGVERRLISVLENLAVDRDRHPLVDLMAEPGEAPVELGDHAAHRIGLDLNLGLPPGETAGSLAGEDDARHQPITRSSTGPRSVAFTPRRGAAAPARRAPRADAAATSAGCACECRWRRRSHWRPPPSAARSAPRRRLWHQTGD